MIVAFDGAGLGDGPPTGVARSFLNGLAAYAARWPGALLLLPAGAADPRLPGLTSVPAPRGALRRQLLLPGLLRRLQADVLHSGVAAVPLQAPCPTVATAHDLPWLHPEAGEVDRWSRRAAVRLALRHATAVLAPSAFTAADVAAVRGHHRGLHLVPHGTPPGPAPTAASVAERRGPLLVLGDDRPRKNRALLRQAHEQARARCPGLPPLQFVGPPDAFVDEAKKLQLLASCRAVVHGARFEGFGMPVLEALAHGAPLACSDLPPCREIAGEHAVWFPADDVAAAAAAMQVIHTDATRRTTNALAGHLRARSFTPELVAERWRAVHQAVAR